MHQCDSAGWLNRRRLLQGAASLGALGFLGRAPRQRGLRRRVDRGTAGEDDAEDILAAMKRGNERFRKGQLKPRNYLRGAASLGQGPIPGGGDPELHRLAGAGRGDSRSGDRRGLQRPGRGQHPECRHPREHGVRLQAAGAKVVLVMGHTACGAIKGAIDNAQLGHLTGLLGKVRPAVDATVYVGERTSKNAAFVDAVARKNVELTMARIRGDSPMVKELQTSHEVLLTGAMYNLETAAVEFFS